MAGEGKVAPVSDRALVVAFQRGDVQAFDEIFKRYHSRVAAICYRMLGSTQDAEEATQETFLKAYQALARFNGSYYVGAWLGRIATNVCVDLLRSRSRSNVIRLPDDREDLLTEEGPEDLVVGDHPRLEEAIKDIQPLHASALALRALEGMSHQEIARRLALSPSQVKALLHRARCSLRRAWDRAEGWAVAPLVGLRHFSSRSSADADRLASVSPSAAPYLMEKVAASAMIVAAALTGLPSTPPEADEVTGRDGSAPRAAAKRSGDAATNAATRELQSAPRRVAVTEPESAPTSEKGPADDLLAQVEEALAAPEETAPEEPSQEPPDEEDSPLGPHAAEGEKAKKKAQKVVREIEETFLP